MTAARGRKRTFTRLLTLLSAVLIVCAAAAQEEPPARESGAGAEGKSPARAQGKRFVIARVNSNIITRLDVERYLKINKQRYFVVEESNLWAEREYAKMLFGDAVRRLIGEHLLIEYGMRQGWVETGLSKPVYDEEQAFESAPPTGGPLLKREPFRLTEQDEASVREWLHKSAKRFGSMSNWRALLEREGLSLEYIKERMRIAILRDRVMSEPTRLDRHVSPAQIREYYRKHIEQYSEPERVTWREISASGPGAEMRIAKALRRLENGEDFSEVARALSQGGTAADGGLVEDNRTSEVVKPLREAIAKMKAGDWTRKPVKVGAELILLKLESRTPARPRPLENYCEEIRRRIIEERADEALLSFYDELAANAHIEILDPGLKGRKVLPGGAR